MPIRVPCSSCGKEYTLADNLLGKKVKCKACNETFLVQPEEEVLKPEIIEDEQITAQPPRVVAPSQRKDGIKGAGPAVPPPLRSKKRRDEEDEDDGPRSRRRRDEDDDDDRPRRRRSGAAQGSNKIIWIVAGATTGVVALVIVVLLLLRSSADEAPVVVQNPGNPNPFNQQPVNPNPVNPNPFNPNPVEQNQNKLPEPPDPFKPQPPNPRPPKQKKNEPAPNPLPPAVKWTGQPDPGPDMTKPPANPNGALKLFGNPTVVYPSTPSPIVGVKHGQGKEGWQIINLHTFKPVAVLNVAPELNDEVISPDGKFMLGKSRKFQLNSAEIIVVALEQNPRVLKTIQIEGGLAHNPLVDFLDNDHIIIQQSKGFAGTFRVFNVTKGTEVKQFPIEGMLDRKNNLALSPGRKYLAVANKDKVDVYQPLTGQHVGELRMPIGPGGQFKGLAFSPDGQELACYQENFGNNSQLVTWKMTTGEQALHHAFAKDLHTLADHAFGYQGHPFEWFADRSGFVFYGQLVVDYQSGAPVYKIPRTEVRGQPRRLVGKEHIVSAGGNFQTQQLSIAALPKDEIATAVKKAREEAGAPVAELPAPRAGDLAAAKTLPMPSGIVPWKVSVETAPNPKGRLAPQPISLRAKPEDIQQIVFSHADAGIAVVVDRSAPNPLSAKKQFRAERYDLLTGKLLGALELFADDKKDNAFGNQGQLKAELSPDGTRLAVRHAKDERRLDIWNLADGKHLVAWEPVGANKLEWFAFVDADRILTAGANNKLTLWKVPECKALYTVDGYRAPMELSPARKYMVAQTGATLEFIDAATGERAGQLETPGGAVLSLLAGAFSRDGKEFVAAVNVPGGLKIARWQMSDGTFKGAMNTSQGAQPMVWISPRHVLHGNTLYDWTLKGGLWLYTMPGQGQQGTSSPDGRAWFAYGLGPNQGTILAAQTLPDAGARALADHIAGGAAQPAVTPGTPVQININAGNGKFNTEVQASLEKTLQAQGYKIGPGGLTIAINAQENATGKTITYRVMRFGLGKGPLNVDIQEKVVECDAEVTDAQGTSLLKTKNVARTPFSMSFKGEDYQNQVDEAMWNNAINWGRFVPLPTNMYRIGGVLQALPKAGSFTPGG